MVHDWLSDLELQIYKDYRNPGIVSEPREFIAALESRYVAGFGGVVNDTVPRRGRRMSGGSKRALAGSVSSELFHQLMDRAIFDRTVGCPVNPATGGLPHISILGGWIDDSGVSKFDWLRSDGSHATGNIPRHVFTVIMDGICERLGVHEWPSLFLLVCSQVSFIRSKYRRIGLAASFVDAGIVGMRIDEVAKDLGLGRCLCSYAGDDVVDDWFSDNLFEAIPILSVAIGPGGSEF